MDWIFGPLKNYATFSGRARRREFWIFLLFVTVVQWGGYYYDAHFGGGEPIALGMGLGALLTTVVFLIPSVAVGVRRLHDSGRSGLWMLLGYGPMAFANLPMEPGSPLELVLAGALVMGIGGLFFMMLIPGTSGQNQYGADPQHRTL
jgi:uncharacterized membrane protein YhaH (DUF805 family)